jgi:branched-chain amino acid transport system substrate-binding protein
VPYVSGFKTYVDWINNQGGVNGHKLKFDVLDDQANPDRGVANTKQLLTEKPIAFLGHIGSVVMIPQQPLLDAAKVPTMTYTGIDQLLTDPYYFTIGLNVTQMFFIQARYIQTLTSGAKPRVAFIILDSPGLAVSRNLLKTSLTSIGWTVVTDQKVPVGATDASAELEAIRSDNPDYIIGGLLDGIIPSVMSKLNTLGIKAPFINFSPGSSDASFQAGAGQFFAVREYVGPQDPSAKTMQDAAAKYGTTSNMTSLTFTKGWVAGLVYTAAIKKCGDTCTGETMQAALQGLSGLDIGGLGAPISFGPGLQQGVNSGRVYQWKDGKVVSASNILPGTAPTA